MDYMKAYEKAMEIARQKANGGMSYVEQCEVEKGVTTSNSISGDGVSMCVGMGA